MFSCLPGQIYRLILLPSISCPGNRAPLCLGKQHPPSLLPRDISSKGKQLESPYPPSSRTGSWPTYLMPYIVKPNPCKTTPGLQGWRRRGAEQAGYKNAFQNQMHSFPHLCSPSLCSWN